MNGHPFAVGDRVHVVGHYTWCGRDTHGLAGTVTAVHGSVNEDGQTFDRATPWPLYDVALPGFDDPAPLAADEIEPAAGVNVPAPASPRP